VSVPRACNPRPSLRAIFSISEAVIAYSSGVSLCTGERRVKMCSLHVPLTPATVFSWKSPVRSQRHSCLIPPTVVAFSFRPFFRVAFFFEATAIRPDCCDWTALVQIVSHPFQ